MHAQLVKPGWLYQRNNIRMRSTISGLPGTNSISHLHAQHCRHASAPYPAGARAVTHCHCQANWQLPEHSMVKSLLQLVARSMPMGPHTIAISLAVRRRARSRLLLSASAAPGLRTKTEVCMQHQEDHGTSEHTDNLEVDPLSAQRMLSCIAPSSVTLHLPECGCACWKLTLMAFQSVPKEQCCMMITVR
jgi:hypothetical protein